MKIESAEFMKSAPSAEFFPETGQPEFAFFGRSNCGKSSLINMLVNRKNLVKTGSRPGMTQLANFFQINKRFIIVDLPGFGYAEVPLAVKQTFKKLLSGYITSGRRIRAAFMLVDLRRTPGDEEIDIINALAEENIRTAIIGTKADKLTKSERKDSVRRIAEALEIDEEAIFVSSSKSRAGRQELLGLLGELVNASES
jgi:GTP-binding protein